MASQRNYTESWLQVEKELGTRPVLTGSTAEELREQFAGLGQFPASQYPPPSTAVQTHEHDVGHCRVRIYTPQQPANKSLPVGIYAHGGGFVLGSLDSEDPLCRAIVENVDTILVSIDYRLAPEHQSPAQLGDVLEAVSWAHENAGRFGGDPNKLFTIGVSAGGGLSLSVARKIVLGQSSLPRDAIKAIIAIVPVAFHPDNVPEEHKSDYTSYEQNSENVPIIEKKTMHSFFNLTKVDPTDKEYFAGLDAEAHKLFPPTYIGTCEFDPLRDDGKVMVKALEKAGVKVKSDHYDGLPHCFFYFPNMPETQDFMANTFAGIKWAIGNM